MSGAERVLGRVVTANNRRLTRYATDRNDLNPRPLAGVAWSEAVEAAHPTIAAEWDAFAASGGRLPRIADVIDEDQGNEGTWRVGLLMSKGKPATELATRFPRTIQALGGVPGIWSALWSELEPGAELPIHNGPNAGMLRYHLGVRCGTDSALRVFDQVVPYVDGVGILFDDTAPHAAWNHGTETRITLFCELLRPAEGAVAVANRLVQSLLALDPRYRGAPARASEWHRALNGPVTR